MIDLDDTTSCPLATRCASWRGCSDLRVCTLMTPIGVLCRTLCADCVNDKRAPRLSIRKVTELVIRHCEHLGIDLDEMADAARQVRDR
ncbi:MAG: hypothetical protein GEU86_21135 [Actinophytocola sp.]|nr:hypothetical protein [Actinophytocola sp.]